MENLRAGRFLGILDDDEGNDPAERVALLIPGEPGMLINDPTVKPVTIINETRHPVEVGALVWMTPNPKYAEDPKSPPWRIISAGIFAADCWGGGD
jgi:hypothetical protein